MADTIWFIFVLCLGAVAVSQAAAPGNDLCADAVVITDTGATSLTSSSVDVTDATATSDPQPSCLASGSSLTRSIWWEFTPTTTGVFTISTCNTETSTTLPDTVLLLLTGACGAFTNVPRGCNDNACAKQSKTTVSLTANTPYYIVAFSGSADVPVLGANSVQIKISRGGTYLTAASNDKCDNAATVALNSTTALPKGAYWTDDYTYNSDCYRDTSVKALGNGGDVVYKFVPTATEKYNFRVISRPSIVAQDAAIVITKNCPTAGTQISYPTCLDGVNRRSDFSELYNCQELSSGLTYYIFVDLVDPEFNSLANISAQYFLEVSLCNADVGGNSPGQAPLITCGVMGDIDSGLGDTADFYQLPTLEKDAWIFALVDGGAATVGAFDLALTTSDNNVVQLFPADNDPIWGSNSASIVGYRLPTTGDYFIRIMSGEDQDVPYQIWTWWERSFSVPSVESEPNNGLATASTLGQFGVGELTGADVDYWRVDVPAQGSFAAVVTACLAPSNGQTTLASGFKLVFRNSSGDSLLSVNGGSSGRCMNMRPLSSGQFYFSVEASGNSGSYALAVSYDCAASNQAGIPSTPIGTVPNSAVPSAPSAPRAPLSLILPVAPLSGPSNKVSLGGCKSMSHVLVLAIALTWLSLC